MAKEDAKSARYEAQRWQKMQAEAKAELDHAQRVMMQQHTVEAALGASFASTASAASGTTVESTSMVSSFRKVEHPSDSKQQRRASSVFSEHGSSGGDADLTSQLELAQQCLLEKDDEVSKLYDAIDMLKNALKQRNSEYNALEDELQAKHSELST